MFPCPQLFRISDVLSSPSTAGRCAEDEGVEGATALERGTLSAPAAEEVRLNSHCECLLSALECRALCQKLGYSSHVPQEVGTTIMPVR